MNPKKFNIFLIVLLCSLIPKGGNACSYSYSEGDYRFYLFKPELFVSTSFRPFEYTTDMFGEWEDSPNEAELQNCSLWKHKCKIDIDINIVYDAIYVGNKLDSSNAFIAALLQQKDYEALEYLAFAKSCEILNSHLSDPWERYSISQNVPLRNQNIQYAIANAAKNKDSILTKRYAFIAIRMLFYNQDYEQLKEVYQTFFNFKNNKSNILDYWAMHFYTLTLEESPEKNILSALVFWNASDKRYAIHYAYSNEIPVSKTLLHCKSKEEKAAVWLLHAVRKTGRAKESLKNVYKNSPNSKAFDFLLARELSKLEDWVFTPYYTHSPPSLTVYDDISYKYKQNRLKRDREYANDILAFIEKIPLSKVSNPKLLLFAKAELQMMISNHQQAIDGFVKLSKQKDIGDELKSLLNQFIVLNKIHLLPNPVITNKELQNGIMELEDKALFAVARVLEYKGNYTESAYLLSKVNEVIWQKDPGYSHNDFFNYSEYIDFTYSNKQLKDFCDDISKLDLNVPYNQWKSSRVLEDKNYLYDLLGTKYMRTNELEKALVVFRKIDPYYLEDKYSYWLNINPFYANFYSEHSPNPADSIAYNKVQIVETLIEYLKRANNPTEKNRDFYYQQVANCYFNMSKNGNAWAMKRFSWTYYESSSNYNYPDQDDYLRCKRAKKYFLKASSLSKDKEFAALCLRMAGRCEKYAIMDRIEEYEYSKDYHQIVFIQNKYYKQLKIKFPDLYEELISNCFEHDRIYDNRRLTISF